MVRVDYGDFYDEDALGVGVDIAVLGLLDLLSLFEDEADLVEELVSGGGLDGLSFKRGADDSTCSEINELLYVDLKALTVNIAVFGLF